jgi:hypothetical protein
VLPSPDRQ